MISAIKGFANPKTVVMTAMLSLAAITGNYSIKAQSPVKYYIPNDTVELNMSEKDSYSKLQELNNIKDVKEYFNKFMTECMKEDAWKGKTSGMNTVEYIELESFCNAASEHENSEISDWAKSKLEEMEYLKNSKYNKQTYKEDLVKSSSKVDKYEKQLDMIKKSFNSPPNFLIYMFFGQDYRKINEHYLMEQKYCERDINYYNSLYNAELNNILSSKSVKKLKAGKGKKVK